MVERRKFRITGHPRCGTGYMAKLFRSFGFDVQHEAMGKDGISSWMFAVPDAEFVPWTKDGSVPKDYEFDYTILGIRNPIHAISSILYTENIHPASILFRSKYIDFTGLNTYEIATHSYCSWNEMIIKQKPDLMVKIEHAPEVIKAWLVSIGLIDEDFEVPQIEKNVNSRPHRQISETELMNAIRYPDLKKRLQNWVNFYKGGERILTWTKSQTMGLRNG